ncbi:MAG: STAS domain-containing protein [Nitrospinales bacterium]
MAIKFESKENDNGSVTLKIRGEIDMNSSPETREVLTSLFDKSNKGIVVDLSGVEYIDSSGIATLVEGLQWSHKSKNKFRLASLTPEVKDIFEIARLLTIFEIFDSPEEALKGI